MPVLGRVILPFSAFCGARYALSRKRELTRALVSEDPPCDP